MLFHTLPANLFTSLSRLNFLLWLYTRMKKIKKKLKNILCEDNVNMIDEVKYFLI